MLGDWAAVAEEVMKGTIEFTLAAVPSIYDPRTDIAFVPYLAKTWPEIKVAYTHGGFIFDTYNEICNGLGVENLASFSQGLIGMATSKAPPSPGDISVPKDMKVRVWAAKPPELVVQGLGYLPTIMPWSDVFSAMQTGVVDGVFGADTVESYTVLHDVSTHWLAYNTFNNCDFLMTNLELWNSLSSEDQQILRAAATRQQDVQLENAEQLEKEYMQKWLDYGAEVIEFTPEELNSFAEMAVKDVWPELNKTIGKGIMDGAVEYVEYLKTLQ